jgi:hypothetical protein
LELYGKQKFNEKSSQEEAKIPLSDEEKQSIEAIQANANASDKKRGKFAKKFGFEIEENKPESIKDSLPIVGIIKVIIVDSDSDI